MTNSPRTEEAKPNDGLTKEQLEFRDVGVSDEDGVVHQKVSAQTIFDSMLISETITVPEHTAVHMFIESLSLSGASIPSVDIASRIDAPAGGRSNDPGDRRMIFSGAYRSMTGRCSDEATRIFMRICGSPLTVSNKSKEVLEELAVVIAQNLSCLVGFYGVGSKLDPRSIIRRQVGSV